MLLPLPERCERLIPHQLNHGNLALGMRLRDFCIDRGIVKADFGGVCRQIAKKNSVDAGPVNGAKAHGTRFAGRVQYTAAQFKASKLLARVADGYNFRVSSGIVAGGNLIRSLSENSALFYDDGSKRATSSRTDVFERQLYGASHESVVHVASFCHRGIVMSVSIWPPTNLRANRSTWTLSLPMFKAVSICGAMPYAKYFWQLISF